MRYPPGDSPIEIERDFFMPRLSRKDLLYEGCYAHVISRSIRKMKLFHKDDDFEVFYKLILKTKKQAGYKIFHYCVMQTHFHMIVSIPSIREFSAAMQYLKSQYSLYFHKKYRLSGPIWRDRFRALLIENEGYMRICGEYIENNPLKAGIVKKAEEWRHSSYRHYNSNEKDGLIDVYEVGDWRAEVEYADEKFFEDGLVIGSTFFQFQMRQKLKKR